MCGICGIFTDDPQPAARDTSIVRDMMHRLAHRGPDGEGVASGKGFVLGHRRLAIIDIETGAQPMTTPDGRYVISYNGEIYNYIELRQRLTQSGAHLKTFSDTEVLLHMLVRQGALALRELNGMFAFAFVDRETGDWIIARDPFGIKPLNYVELPGEVVFASETKGLFAHPKIKPEASWASLQQYLTFQFCLEGDTLFKNVRQLEPGFYLEGRHGKILRRVRYWDTSYQIDDHHTEEYFKDRLVGLLEDTARLQIRSDAPLGAYLSGGLDSSVVSCLAADHLGIPLPMFHGKFAEGPQYDESPYAEAVAATTKGILHTAVPTAQQFVDMMPKLIYAMDEPVAGPGLFPQYVVSELASAHVKVVLGGQGGDEVFGGYARYLVGYLEQALKGAILGTQEEGKYLVTLSSIVPNLSLLREYTPLLQTFWREGLFGEMDARYFRLIDRMPDSEHLLTPDARAACDRKAIFDRFQKVFNHPDTRSYFNKMTHFDQKTLLPALLHVEDRVSMMVSIESRVPLLDTRIVDLVTKMPPPMKFHTGRTKHIFRSATKHMVPEVVSNRHDKMGFPVPLKEWMAAGPVRGFVQDVLLSKRCRERGIFETKAMEKLIATEGAFGRQLWGALCLELWYQRFIDPQ